MDYSPLWLTLCVFPAYSDGWKVPRIIFKITMVLWRLAAASLVVDTHAAVGITAVWVG